MLSFNRVFFLSLGSVCILITPFFWLALVFDYKALENVMITLSKSYFVGYPIPELFGASKVDSISSQVFRLKIFFSLLLLTYSLFFLGLSSVEENRRRFQFLFRGISIPLFLIVVAFWLKFVNEDHIIIQSEKLELFLATTICLVISIFLFAYSFRSRKKKPFKFNNNLPVVEKTLAEETLKPQKSSDTELSEDVVTKNTNQDSDQLSKEKVVDGTNEKIEEDIPDLSGQNARNINSDSPEIEPVKHEEDIGANHDSDQMAAPPSIVEAKTEIVDNIELDLNEDISSVEAPLAKIEESSEKNPHESELP